MRKASLPPPRTGNCTRLQCSCIALLELLDSYLSHLCRSGVATVLLVSDLEATGGRDADLAYMRVAGDIAARITSGELKPAARLRAERDLAEHYEVSYRTIR